MMCYKSIAYLGGVEIIGVQRSPELRLKQGLTCHDREGKLKAKLLIGAGAVVVLLALALTLVLGFPGSGKETGPASQSQTSPPQIETGPASQSPTSQPQLGAPRGNAERVGVSDSVEYVIRDAKGRIKSRGVAR